MVSDRRRRGYVVLLRKGEAKLSLKVIMLDKRTNLSPDPYHKKQIFILDCYISHGHTIVHYNLWEFSSPAAKGHVVKVLRIGTKGTV